MSYTKGSLLYEGKAKTIFSVLEDENLLWQEFKNSLTAFNGVKRGEFDVKGSLNRDISSKIFNYLKSNNIPSHMVDLIGENVMITKKLKMIPLEVVMRNIVAGSLKKKFNLEEGREINPALVEFYFKNDELNDPFISDDHILMLKILDSNQIAQIKELGLAVNKNLKDFFAKVGIDLVDFKIEIGFDKDGQILLADEISPDSCRLWDSKTKEKFDKDRFRYDLGDVKTGYIEIYNRLKSTP
ncbi:MAG: phosphoribosylaminoimidazolesuccinocarboxamide synthase [Bdellovibrionota bacterium]